VSTKYKFRNPDGLYFVTFATVGWVDVFTRKDYKDILIGSIRHCQREKGLVVYAYVIMSNHAHMIIARRGEINLEDIMRDLKKYTSSAILKAIQENEQESRREWMLEIFREAGRQNSNNVRYQFWRQDNHPIELDTNRLQDQKLEYIHNNPVEAGLVDDPKSYIYSSARDYEGIPGLIEVEFIE
jgi:REP element-mobilizing transposase RayT